MAVEFHRGRLEYRPSRGHRLTQSKDIQFSGPVRNVQVMLNGYQAQFVNGDQNLHQIEINLAFQTRSESSASEDARDRNVDLGPDQSLRSNFVHVIGYFGLRDASGTFDDPYSGYIDFVVAGDVGSN